LEILAINQTEHGPIPSLVHDEEDRRSSDTSPLFLLGVGIFRKMTDEHDFLQDAVSKSLTWMDRIWSVCEQFFYYKYISYQDKYEHKMKLFLRTNPYGHAQA
jgi:hypothetical protein